MRFATVLLGAIAVVSCATSTPTRGPSQATTPSSSPAVEFLLSSAATDFHTHAPPRPVRFRNVRSGYVTAMDGARQYRLCGEFLPAEGGGKVEWTPFATLQTSGYEQWLGAQAVRFCQPSSMTWDAGDLSSSLQSRLDALGKTPTERVPR